MNIEINFGEVESVSFRLFFLRIGSEEVMKERYYQRFGDFDQRVILI